MDFVTLYQQAVAARANAYAPYSHFAVGACLLAKDGRTFLGCNVENASFGATICAERSAIVSAIVQGARDFAAIAIVGGFGDDVSKPCFPCAMCLQVMREFCAQDFVIVVYDKGTACSYTLGELLPHSFKLED